MHSLRVLFAALVIAIASTLVPGSALAATGETWTARASAVDNSWASVTYGGGLFVAVSWTGTGNRVMTSPDGITWTARVSAVDNNWTSVTYGGGLFVAVSGSGSGNRVMTSPDGITWTLGTSAADNWWQEVTYGNGLFVAVSASGSGNRVMTSPDGTTWTARTSAADNYWSSVAYGGGLFVAVSTSGIGNRVMTSGPARPNTPVAPSAVAGDASATVTVALASSGDVATSHTITASPGGATCTVSGASGSCLVSGLANGTAYTFTATATNARGTSAASVASAAITPEVGCTVPPGSVGMSINDGDDYTNTPLVTLSVIWPLCTATVSVSNDGGFRQGQTVSSAATIPWRLVSSGAERLPKTVYLRFSDSTTTYTDDIILDQTPPLVLSVSATALGGGAGNEMAAGQRIRLRVRARDSVSGVGFIQAAASKSRPGAKRPYASVRLIRVAGKRVYVRVQDRAGNWSRWRTVQIR